MRIQEDQMYEPTYEERCRRAGLMDKLEFAQSLNYHTSFKTQACKGEKWRGKGLTQMSKSERAEVGE